MHLPSTYFSTEFQNNLQTFRITEHAKLRMAQRNISLDDLKVVIWAGGSKRQRGAISVFFGQRHIPESLANNDDFTRLNGTIIILERDGNGNRSDYYIKTVMRNRNGKGRRIKYAIV